MVEHTAYTQRPGLQIAPKYINLLDLLPEIENQQELRELSIESQKYLFENGKTYTSADEVMFITILERYIQLFTKAKQMVANGRFTVVNKGDPDLPKANITDFEVVPIQKKT